MKKPTTLKHLGLMLLVSSFAVGCASTTEEAPQEPAAVEPAPAPAPEPVAPAPEPTTMNYEVVRGATDQCTRECKLRRSLSSRNVLLDSI